MEKTSGEIDRKFEKVVARRKAERFEALARLMYRQKRAFQIAFMKSVLAPSERQKTLEKRF